MKKKSGVSLRPIGGQSMTHGGSEGKKIRSCEDKKIRIPNLLTSQVLNIGILLFTVYCSLFLIGCAEKEKMYKESRIVMDTFCTITVVSPSRKEAKEAIAAGFTEIKRLEQLLNFFSADSEVTDLNRASGREPVKVSRDTLNVIKKAVEIANYTDGAFDPTIGPLMRLWGFESQNPKPSIPLENKIKDALRFVDYKKIKINNVASQIFLEEKGMEIDLGGIAKGYAADRAIETIKAKGIKAALVAIAGDIKTFGLKPDLQPWKIGIQNPRIESGVRGQGSGVMNEEDIFASLYIKDKAISTSGDYQRFFIQNGKQYHHILNPGTGYPAAGVISVSIIAPEGYMADGLSTGIFVLGPDKGIKLLESMGFDGMIVDANKKIFITKNLKGKINLEGELKNSVK